MSWLFALLALSRLAVAESLTWISRLVIIIIEHRNMTGVAPEFVVEEFNIVESPGLVCT